MKAATVRETFLNFFESKGHHIVPSAPMVIKDDPSLMFTNAGMNQFKDIFLGHAAVTHARIADTQKCLRVSGKHNDLEEVGLDTYHHTMFEMLGNWSFGDYFKKEAIQWAWELLTEVFRIEKERLYVSVFEGDPSDGLPEDREAYQYWREIVPGDRIIFGSKKDNFWEMGDTGPCGPCSEIHADLRADKDREEIPGHTLVNKGHPLVIEIWNLVFIEFNRTAAGALVNLPQKHVDTGMGFERLCMVMQHKTSNYDTDVFQPIIHEISRITGIPYGRSTETDIAIRVVADHFRAIAFAIADGQLPSNKDAGYVIRRILRRAVRYGFTFLGQKEPFIHLLLPGLIAQMAVVFPELSQQQELITKVIAEEENAFLKTLSTGIKRFEQHIQANPSTRIIDGKFAFELFDTYGFPVDLTQLMAKELALEVDMDGFQKGLEGQKMRSRQATQMDTDDWVILDPTATGSFIGYDHTHSQIRIARYRQVKAKGSVSYQLVFDRTPFYAESGGQIGDTGFIESDHERIPILDTKKEGNLILHITHQLPSEPTALFTGTVDLNKRLQTARNHSATHLLHHALREVLGRHVEQKGSFVGPDHLRFDFSHFQKVSDTEIAQVEAIVNQQIRENHILQENRMIPMEKALGMGALAFFGEKYGDQVRVIRFGDSIELCGGTHVHATGQIGLFKIIAEEATAAGVRRIAAITGDTALDYLNEHLGIVRELKHLLRNSQNVIGAVHDMMDANDRLAKKLDELQREKIKHLEEHLILQAEMINGITFIGETVDLDAEGIRDLAFRLRNKVTDLFLVLGAKIENKAHLAVMISDSLVQARGFHAGKLIRDLALEIQGGGGGQPYFATAGGKFPGGLPVAIQKAKKILLTE